ATLTAALLVGSLGGRVPYTLIHTRRMRMTRRMVVRAHRLLPGLLVAALVGGGLLPLQAQTEDQAAVERAALDYLEGFYEGSTEKIRRGVHPDVVKFGFFRQSADQEYQRVPMSFDEMLAFATNVKESGRFPGDEAPKRVELLDVLDQTAVAKVYAWWGSDYLTMAKYDGEWKVVQVLWQSPAMD
ncbi:MAG: nuclear transport factor 2 family protein, partial [Myxococcota bacterium]